MKNRWRLVGVIGLAVAIFLGARAVGWIVQRRAIVSLQRQLIADINELDGHAYYDYQLLHPDTPKEQLVDSDNPSIKRHPLASVFGDDWFHDVFYVTYAQADGIPQDRHVAVRGEIGDERILPLLQLPHLRWLALSGTAISDAGVAQLSEKPQIRRVWLSRTQIGDQSLKSLAQCSTLTHLAIDATPTSDVGVAHIAQLPELRFLSLGSPYITADGLSRLSHATSLEELHLDRLPVNERVAKELKKLTRLRILSLRMTPITDPCVIDFGPLKQLEELHLDGTLITDDALVAASNWKLLETLTLANTNITDVGLQSLAACTQLESLDVAQTKVSLAGVEALFVQRQSRTWLEALQTVFQTRMNDQQQLISLDLNPLRMSDDEMHLLLPLTELQWLMMPNNRLTDAGIEILMRADWQHLSLLRLDNANIGDSSLERLGQLPALRTLHIANTHVTPAAIAELAARRPGLRVYTEQPSSTTSGRHQSRSASESPTPLFGISHRKPSHE